MDCTPTPAAMLADCLIEIEETAQRLADLVAEAKALAHPVKGALRSDAGQERGCPRLMRPTGILNA